MDKIKTKTILTQEDLKLSSKELMKKYNLGRTHSYRVMKQGYFWKNAQEIQQSLSPQWVEKHFEEITEAVKYAVKFKSFQNGFIHHRLFKEYKEDLFQEGFLYVVLRAGEIESGKSKLGNIAKTGVAHAMLKFFFYGDGGHTVGKFDFWDDKSIKMVDPSTEDEINLDNFFINTKNLISSISEEYWEEVWNWALSRKTKCPERVRAILEEVEL